MVPSDLVDDLDPEMTPGLRNRIMQAIPGGGKVNPHDVYVVPEISGQARYTAYVDCVENARCALLERVFYHQVDGVFKAPPAPKPAGVAAALQSFSSALKRHIKRLTPVPLLDYPELAYRGRKLIMYLEAAKLVARRGSQRRDAFLSTFVKFEKLLNGLKRVVPRVIQPRRPAYNVAVGRYMRQLEHFLYHDIDSVYGRPTVMKGKNADERGALMAEQWARYRDPAALGLDASRFDQHISEALLKWEHSIYDMYYNDPELRKLLSWQLKNKGFVRCGDGGIKYEVAGGRCSGDMNTACGNCLIACGALYSLLTQLGCVHHGKHTSVSVFDDGDDMVLIGERKDLERIASAVPGHFGNLGLVMKIEPLVSTLEQVTFCQCQPVNDGKRWRMVRQISASLSKDAVLMGLPLNGDCLSHQLYAIGECGMALTAGLPVLQEYYQAMIRGGKPGGTGNEKLLESGFYRLSRGMDPKFQPVSSAARVSFYYAFGITPDLQVALEKYYMTRNIDIRGPPTLDEQPRILGL